MARTLLLVCLLASALAAPAPDANAQDAVTSLRGSWSATIGNRPALQGTWSAELQEKTPNAASGTWTLVGAGGTVVARGTWTATKTSGAWSGAWAARAAGGGSRSGTWRADAGGGAKTFAGLLRSSLETQLTGAWRSGGLQGRWALKAAS